MAPQSPGCYPHSNYWKVQGVATDKLKPIDPPFNAGRRRTRKPNASQPSRKGILAMPPKPKQ